MNIYNEPSSEIWEELCLRPSSDNPQVRERVEAIIERVRKDKDKALFELSAEIDSLMMNSLEVTKDEIEAASQRVSENLKAAISAAIRNITAFHKAQMPVELKVETQPGVSCIQRPVPIEKVGLYIPGGTAPLFSTVLMLAIPAKVAGCKEIILCTPADRSTGLPADAVLYAARQCGVTRIFKVGGAQAIAALAYGTESIPRVHKIFGPGNQYVTTAKQMLGGRQVAIDMPAGPSEVMVIADKQANAAFIAADLLSQAEHGRDSQVMLLCDDQSTAAAVEQEVLRQTALLGREEFIEAALSKSRFVVFSDWNKIVEFANAYAPEHLIISTAEPWKIADRITSAGSVFVGAWSPESAGDYASGTNHTLPTCGWADSYNGVNTESFIKKITFQELTQNGLSALSKTIISMAEAEGLDAHANAVKVRMQ